MKRARILVLLGVAAAVGCGAESEQDDPGVATSGGGNAPPDTSIAVLGGGRHDAAQVVMTEIGRALDGLDVPRDVAFDPSVPGQLWVVNYGDNSVVVYSGAGEPGQTVQRFSGAVGSEHFLSKPSALAFGAPGRLATIQDEDQLTQGNQTPPDFMGPTLWDVTIFDGGLASHLDMLHNSPLGMGIAWQRDNVYWVFDGAHGAITRYDFGSDHGPAGTDHSDGIITRYAEGQVRRLESVASHMELLAGTAKLYIADTGNARIGVLDTAAGSPGGSLGPNYDSCTMNRVDGPSVETFIDGNAALAVFNGIEIPMPSPSGLTFHSVPVGGVPQDVLFVTDPSTATIYGFSLDGVLFDWLWTGLPPGSLAGLAFDASGELYVADPRGNRVLRFASVEGG